MRNYALDRHCPRCGQDSRSNGGWGHTGSTGQSNGCGGMGTMSGLGEGFRRL